MKNLTIVKIRTKKVNYATIETGKEMPVAYQLNGKIKTIFRTVKKDSFGFYIRLNGENQYIVKSDVKFKGVSTIVCGGKNAISNTIEKERNISRNMVALVTDYVTKQSAKTGEYFFANHSELLSTIVENSYSDSDMVANTLHFAPKLFKAQARKLAKTDIYLTADDIYMATMVKMMESVQSGKEIKSLLSTFWNHARNVVRTENNRMQNNDFLYMDKASAEGEKTVEVALYEDSHEYYGKIPVEKIVRDMDMSSIFDEKESQIIAMKLKGMKTVEVEKIVGQRIDRIMSRIKDKVEAYVNYAYSI